MADLLLLLVVLGFFALAAGFVGVCDRITGRDDLPHPAPSPGDGGDAGTTDTADPITARPVEAVAR